MKATRRRALLIPVLAGVGVLSATPAMAGPCETMAGARWVVYFERDWNSVRHISTGVLDFREGTDFAAGYFGFAPAASVSNNMSNIAPNGWLRGLACQNLSASTAVIVSIEPWSVFHMTPEASGQSAAIRLSETGHIVGWASRLPNPPTDGRR